MEKFWYIYGAGGCGRETMDILQHAIRARVFGEYNCWFVEDIPKRSFINGLPVCKLNECKSGSKITIAIGEPNHRVEMLKKIRATDLKLASIISPWAFMSPSAKIGRGVVVAPQCTIQANSIVGQNSYIYPMSIIGHDVKVRENNLISAMVTLAGGVKVGRNSFIGSGAFIKEGLTIGNKTVVASGSIVHKDLPDGMMAIGNPARIICRGAMRKLFS